MLKVIRQKETVAYLLMIALALVVMYLTKDYSHRLREYPRLLAYIMLALSAIGIGANVFRFVKFRRESDSIQLPSGKTVVRWLVFAVWNTLFVFVAVPSIGFLVSSVIYIIGCLAYYKVRPRNIIITCLAFAVIYQLLFVAVLNLQVY